MVRKKRDEGLPEVPHAMANEGSAVEVVRTKMGSVYLRPKSQAKAWDRLGDEGAFLAARIQSASSDMEAAAIRLDESAMALRRLGASWAMLGWSVGLTGQAMSMRYSQRMIDDE